MGRLIDADKLKQHYSWWGGLIGDDYVSELVEQKKVFDTIIDVQPTVDAVEVVRCKDCIYYHKGDWYDDDVCKVHSNNDRGYCAWGERK